MVFSFFKRFISLISAILIGGIFGYFAGFYLGEQIDILFFNEDSVGIMDIIWILSTVVGATLGGIFLNRPIGSVWGRIFTSSIKLSKDTISEVAENPMRTTNSILSALAILASGLLFGLFTAVAITYLILGTSIGRSLFFSVCSQDSCGVSLWALSTLIPILSFMVGFVLGLYLGDKYLKSID